MIKKTSASPLAGAEGNVSMVPGGDSGGRRAVLDTTSPKAQFSSALPLSFENLTVSPSKNIFSPECFPTLPSGEKMLGKICICLPSHSLLRL